MRIHVNEPTQIACPIRGHDHTLTTIQKVVQDDTHKEAVVLECPSGNYRWLYMEWNTLHQPAPGPIKMIRPRWGWTT